LRPTDLASILERSPNSISMLVDRMVKAGLVRRTRDKKDRRVVFVSMTDKGMQAVDPAAPAGW
jgi:DNA-binding MarR family transcriptional regulator